VSPVAGEQAEVSDIAVVSLWLALGLIGYAYAAFPLLLILTSTVRPRPVRQRPVTPPISLIIAAHNEEECIAERIENALGADYPPSGLDIIVASDGSSDATERIVSRYQDRGVRLLSLPRRGKIAALDDAVREARGTVLVFSDANSIVAPGAFRAIARNFADPAVGGVVASTAYRMEGSGESSRRGENLYWRYDTWLKRLESATGSVVSAHGGLYAIRRNLYQAPVDAAVTDDFIISTAVIAQGYRLVFEPEARAWEVPVPTAKREFGRRVRLMTRGMRAVARRRALLNPFRHGFYSTVLFTHKVVRRLLFVPLVILFAATAALSGQHPAYTLALLAQVLFLALAGLGFALRRAPLGGLKLFYVPFFFCMANLASLLAFVRFVRGDRIVSWQPQRHASHA
jgi:cellulose synthase/poly-beta-1,6-N-acetylglucosamine synthase-like glycosyltransferase